MIATSLSEFVAHTGKIAERRGAPRSTQPLWFRGQASAKWPLLPKAYRRKGTDHFERERHRDFKLSAPTLLNGVPGYRTPASALEWMCLMQHHGLSTRLIDWTETATIALWFAVEGPSRQSTAASTTPND